MLRRERHDREEPIDELEGHVRVEQVAHRVDKHPTRLAPSQRIIKPILVAPDHAVEVPVARLVQHSEARVLRQPLEAPRHPHRVAVIAAGRDTCAARNRVPRRVRPLDV